MAALLSLVLALASAAEAPAVPRLSERCILEAVAGHLGIGLKPETLPPVVRYQSRTPLRYFQDAVEKQWKSRPPVFLNAYVPERDEIFILDEAEYYRKLSRLIDDSIAHELVHFIQVRYQNARLDEGEEYLEAHAVGEQNWLRERLKAGDGPRELCPGTGR